MGASQDEGGWDAARQRSREGVRAAFAARSETCPACGRTVEADTRTCPACGASLVQTRVKRRPTLRGMLVALGVVAVVGIVLVPAIRGLRGDAAVERRQAAARQKRLVAAETRRLTALGKPRRARGPRPPAAVRAAARRPGPAATNRATTTVVLAYRARLVHAGETAITADARRRQPDDPPRGTDCTPTPDGPTREAQERNATVRANRYECIAYERRFALSELQGRARTGIFGTPYWLVADYRTGGLTLCRMTPRGGEGARTLANVVVDAACRDPFERQGRAG